LYQSATGVSDPRWMKRVSSVVECCCAVGTEVGHSLVQKSPRMSRTRNP
jgi:hypothetical protein